MAPNAQPLGRVGGRRVFPARHAYPFAASAAVGASVDDPAQLGPAPGTTVAGPQAGLGAAQHLQLSAGHTRDDLKTRKTNRSPRNSGFETRRIIRRVHES